MAIKWYKRFKGEVVFLGGHLATINIIRPEEMMEDRPYSVRFESIMAADNIYDDIETAKKEGLRELRDSLTIILMEVNHLIEAADTK